MEKRKVMFRAGELITLFLFGVLYATGSQSNGAPSATQENVATLRVNVDLVLVEVVVLDGKGKPIPGLKKEDFQIFQDDKEQQVSTFDVAAASSPPRSVNDLDEPIRRGKVVLLLFDQSTINPAGSRLALDAAEQYVRQHMHPYDLMGVAVYVQTVKITCPLTHDPARVIDAIRRANEPFAGAAGLVVQGTTGAKELRSQVQEVFRGLKGLCSSLEPVRGRKTVLLFTEDLSMPADILGEFNSVVREARKSNVSFFTLDARGRTGSSTNSASITDANLRARPATTTRDINLAQFQDQTSSTILRSLANQTNGYPIYNTDNLAEALDRVDLELGHYYVLGFQSGNARSDGKPHKIEVKLNLKDARLKYRDTYTEPHPTDPLVGSKSEDSLRAALTSKVAATQVPVSFRPVYFYETPQLAEVPIFVKIRRGSIGLKKKSGQWTGSASVMGIALTEDGYTASRFSGEVHVVVGDAQAEAFRNQDLIYRNLFRLRPGKYHLKLAVMDDKGKAGTAEQSLSIPAANQGGLVASSLIITQEMVPLPSLIKDLKPEMLSHPDPMQFKGFQIYAPVQAEIDRRQPLIVFYRIYLTSGANAGRLFKAKVSAIDEKGESHPFPDVDLASSALPAGPNEVAIGFMLPCGDLKPGNYRLAIDTVDEGNRQSVSSLADFSLH